MRVILLLLLLTGSVAAKAQKQGIIFYNDSIKKAVQVRTGGILMVQYSGYLKQQELTTNYLLELNDSTLTLGKPRMFNHPVNVRRIKIKDVTGFRKVSAGTQLLKFALTVGATLGTYYAISENDNLNSTEQLLYSTAAGLTTSFTLKLAFPSRKAKYKIKDGWRIMVR
ncbi:hypothetical protein E9993_16330 [Labilibacter sediminis]|nr:hypothetical protein E9993_16330 [Labilibacter sediminis]